MSFLTDKKYSLNDVMCIVSVVISIIALALSPIKPAWGQERRDDAENEARVMRQARSQLEQRVKYSGRHDFIIQQKTTAYTTPASSRAAMVATPPLPPSTYNNHYLLRNTQVMVKTVDQNGVQFVTPGGRTLYLPTNEFIRRTKPVYGK